MKIVINALSLRPGGGLQVIAGLISSFSPLHQYIVFYSDSASLNFLKENLDGNPNIVYVNPVGSTHNIRLFAWQMLNLGAALKKYSAEAVLNVNHHFPTAGIRQVVYHLNVLRFQRERGSVFSLAEIADRLRDWRAVKALRNADANVFESSYLEQLSRAVAGPAKGKCIVYIGLKPGAASEVTPAKGPVSSTMLAITSPQPHKDNHVLLEVLALLRSEYPLTDWRLKIAGGRTPEAFNELKLKSEVLGVASSVEWLGFLGHSEIQSHAVTSLCLISASRVESFCMVALEAMRWGLPPVVANATSMPESVGDAGLLAESGNVNEFARAVKSLYDDFELWSKLRSKGLQRATFSSWTTAASKMEAILTA